MSCIRYMSSSHFVRHSPNFNESTAFSSHLKRRPIRNHSFLMSSISHYGVLVLTTITINFKQERESSITMEEAQPKTRSTQRLREGRGQKGLSRNDTKQRRGNERMILFEKGIFGSVTQLMIQKLFGRYFTTKPKNDAFSC